jgi:hypothetical protein
VLSLVDEGTRPTPLERVKCRGHRHLLGEIGKIETEYMNASGPDLVRDRWYVFIP